MDKTTQQYVLGFAFSKESNGNDVLLIRKARPTWQKGKLNGVGGEIEDGETALDAMVREFREETGLTTDPICWTYFAVLDCGGDKSYKVFCYYAHLPQELLVRARSGDPAEPLLLCRTTSLPSNTLRNVDYLIQLANDNSLMPVTLTYR